VDVASASAGRFDPDPQAVFERWDEFCSWSAESDAVPATFEASELQAPVPRPRQVFGIGLNYADHAEESKQPAPTFPVTFTKFPSCITGPNAVVSLPSANVDWEVELVVVMGRHAWQVTEAEGWLHVAGLTVGQDLSDRVVQLRPPSPQFCLGKSSPGFGPIGPWMVTPDAIADRDDLPLACEVNGEVMQESRTSSLIFSVPRLIHLISSITPLLPGDLIFTGTPSGVGMAKSPPRFLNVGDVVESIIGGIGRFTTRFTVAP
jgi:2-keto-4-pentenoate hydratase/2-oxohepta-3-ene-1,7-dioic acid hydratase in catechol pathway